MVLGALYLCSFMSNFLHSVKIKLTHRNSVTEPSVSSFPCTVSQALKKKRHHKMGVQAGPECCVCVYAHVMCASEVGSLGKV